MPTIILFFSIIIFAVRKYFWSDLAITALLILILTVSGVSWLAALKGCLLAYVLFYGAIGIVGVRLIRFH